MKLADLSDLSDAQLLGSLKSTCGQGRALLARLLAHLIEVEARRLHLEAACPSMFQFCVSRLGMSEDEACRRIHAARLARRFPDLLVRIENGDLTLSTIALLHDALTEANYEELAEAAAGKTKAEVQALLAKRFPTRDVPAAITVIPTQPPIPALEVEGGVEAVPAPASARGPQFAPLSATRHRVQFTASDEMRQKLERAQDLMRHANADGDLAVVLERAVDLLLEKLEKQRLGKTSRARSSREQSAAARGDTARVSRPARRAVFERDGERCTFTDHEGHRCSATTWLELDHVIPRACGGTSDAGNLRVRCRAHNALYAEQTFGKEHVARKVRERRDPRQRGYAFEELRRRGDRPGEHGFPPCRSAARARHRERAPWGRGAGGDPRPNHSARGAGGPDVAPVPATEPWRLNTERERTPTIPEEMVRRIALSVLVAAAAAVVPANTVDAAEPTPVATASRFAVTVDGQFAGWAHNAECLDATWAMPDGLVALDWTLIKGAIAGNTTRHTVGLALYDSANHLQVQWTLSNSFIGSITFSTLAKEKTQGATVTLVFYGDDVANGQGSAPATPTWPAPTGDLAPAGFAFGFTNCGAACLGVSQLTFTAKPQITLPATDAVKAVAHGAPAATGALAILPKTGASLLELRYEGVGIANGLQVMAAVTNATTSATFVPKVTRVL